MSAHAWLTSWMRTELGIAHTHHAIKPTPEEWAVRLDRIEADYVCCRDLQARILSGELSMLDEVADAIDELGHVCAGCGECFDGLPPAYDSVCETCAEQADHPDRRDL